MLDLRSLVLACAASGVALAALHESHPVPAGWVLDGAPDAQSTMKLSIALTPNNFDAVVNRLYEVSDPAHADYGKHMGREELHSKIRPSAASHAAVLNWLRQSGIQHASSDSMNIDFAGSVGTVNRMLNTTFAYYRNADGARKLRTTAYHLPDDVSAVVDILTPTVYFGHSTAAVATAYTRKIGSPETHGDLASPACSAFISPGCLNGLYNVGTYQADPSFGANVGFGSFLNQSANYVDLNSYEGFYQIPAQTFAVETVHGGVNNQSAAIAQLGEANLDVQNIVGVAHPLPVREYITGGSPPAVPDVNQPTAADNQNEPYFAYYKYLLSQSDADLPQVITNSYGDVEETVPIKFAKVVCNQIAQLGVRGISVLHSSGDLGVGAGCKSNVNGKPRFEPIFPASCPYVTAVGGTQSVNPEVAWVGSSGGFSNYFTRPSYQNGAVINYLQKYIPASTLSYYQPYFDQNGRGFPDISAHSLTPDYLIVLAGDLYTSGGTSAASPVVAAIVGLLNDARFRNNQTQLGFLNPLLYSTGASALHDITGGGSVGCNGVNGQTGQKVNGSRIIPFASWNATVGWDPVTGLGTPNFQKLVRLVTSK